ncbi:MAG TPA: hypothetical protein VNN79_10815 [Actinomycetota bacterium]|nr:hypothetical protein [Actinomycetota bacterium]
MHRVVVAAAALAVLFAGCGTAPSAFSARMTSWSPVDDGQIVVSYMLRNGGPDRARIGCIVTATDGDGNTVSIFHVSDMVAPHRSARTVGYLQIPEHSAFQVRGVTVGDCSRAADDYQPAPPAED